MRTLKGKAISALALASVASAAVAVVPTGEAIAESAEHHTDELVNCREADITSVTARGGWPSWPGRPDWHGGPPFWHGGRPDWESYEDSSSTSTTTITSFSTETVATSIITVSSTEDATGLSQAPAASTSSSSLIAPNDFVTPLSHNSFTTVTSAATADVSSQIAPTTSASTADIITTVYQTTIVTVVAQEVVTDYANALLKARINGQIHATTQPPVQLQKKDLPPLGWYATLIQEYRRCENQHDLLACWNEAVWVWGLQQSPPTTFNTFFPPPTTNSRSLECLLHPWSSSCPASLLSPTLSLTIASVVSAAGFTAQEVEKRAVETDYNVITTKKTITIPAATTTVLVTGSPPPPATGTHYSTLASATYGEQSTPKVAIAIAQVQTESTNSSAIKSTTVIKTVTIQIPTQNSVTAVSTLHTGHGPAITTVSVTPAGNVSTTTCTENTSIDTDSYINISTFSMSGFTPTGLSGTSMSNMPTGSSTRLVTVSTKTKATTTDDTMGFTGAVTSTLGSDSSKSVDFGGVHVPAAMVAAMAACLALALLL